MDECTGDDLLGWVEPIPMAVADHEAMTVADPLNPLGTVPSFPFQHNEVTPDRQKQDGATMRWYGVSVCSRGSIDAQLIAQLPVHQQRCYDTPEQGQQYSNVENNHYQEVVISEPVQVQQNGIRTRSSSADWSVDDELLVDIDVSVFAEGSYTPTDQDVIRGRGGKVNKWPGNKWLLNEKKKFEADYKDALKEEKGNIAQRLVDAVHTRGGKFVEFHEEMKIWFEVSNKTARGKCLQQLRNEHTPEKYKDRRDKYAKKRKSKESKQTDNAVTLLLNDMFDDNDNDDTFGGAA